MKKIKLKNYHIKIFEKNKIKKIKNEKIKNLFSHFNIITHQKILINHSYSCNINFVYIF